MERSSEVGHTANTPSVYAADEREQSLLAALRNGDEAAFVDLVKRYQGYLLPLVRFYVSNRAVAEEVVQETWVAVLEGLDRFEGRSSLKTWISRIAMNRAKTRGERESRAVSFSSLAGDEAAEPFAAVDADRFQGSQDRYPGHWMRRPEKWDLDPERRLLNDQAMEALEQAVGRLPEAQQLVLRMRDIDGSSGEEVCNILGISETNQRVLLHRARSRVRKDMEIYFAKPRGHA